MVGALNLDTLIRGYIPFALLAFNLILLILAMKPSNMNLGTYYVFIVSSFVLAGPKKPLKDRVEVKGPSGLTNLTWVEFLRHAEVTFIPAENW